MSVLDRVTDWLLRRAAPAPAKKSAVWSLDQPYFVTGGGPFNPSYGTEINYAAAAGDLSANSAVSACIGWLMRAEPEAPWRLQRRQGENLTTLYDHALLSLLLRPNPYYSGLALRQATVMSFNLAGNAYWRKVRNGAGRVVELWYEPHFTIRAVGTRDEFLQKYQVYRYGQWLDVDPADVIHFRDGLDPTNPRYGLSRLASVLREVATDQEAARYSYSMLTNTGIIPVVYTPKDPALTLTVEEATAIKAAHQRNFTGDHRGEVAVMQAALDVHRISIPPEEMSAETLHRVPESRIAANLDVPAVIVGLLVGLEHSTYSNMGEAREHAYEGNLIPYQRAVADTVQHQLVPEFDDPARLLVDFDLSNIRVLQEDQDKKVTRSIAAYQGGIATRNEARINIGLAPDTTETPASPPPASGAFLTALATLAQTMPEMNRPFLWRQILTVAGVPDVDGAIREMEAAQAEAPAAPAPDLAGLLSPAKALTNGHAKAAPPRRVVDTLTDDLTAWYRATWEG